MEFKAVWSIPVSDFPFKPFRQIDDLDRREGTSLDTLAASNTHSFREETDLARDIDLNTFLASFIDGTCFATFLAALLWFAPIRIDDRNT